MSLPHIILGLLRNQPKSGYELNKDLDTVVHYFWEADISRIYRALAQMREKGWVDYETVVQEDSPNKKVYSLKPEGRKELIRWLSEPGKSSGVNNPFLAQLHFCAAISAEAQLHVMEARLSDLREETRELERRVKHWELQVPLPKDSLAKGLPRDLLSLEYGLRRLRFELEWAENTVAALRNAVAAER